MNAVESLKNNVISKKGEERALKKWLKSQSEKISSKLVKDGEMIRLAMFILRNGLMRHGNERSLKRWINGDLLKGLTIRVRIAAAEKLSKMSRYCLVEEESSDSLEIG